MRDCGLEKSARWINPGCCREIWLCKLSIFHAAPFLTQFPFWAIWDIDTFAALSIRGVEILLLIKAFRFLGAGVVLFSLSCFFPCVVLLMSSLLTRQRFKRSWKKKFKGSISSNELVFPSSLSPMSTIGDYSAVNLIESPNTSFFSGSSMTSTETDYILETLSKPKGPKVQPFHYSQSQMQPRTDSRRKLSNVKCFICGEAVTTKLADESIIELACGDFIHEHCLKISIDVALKRAFENFSFTTDRKRLATLLYPCCKGDNCNSNTDLQKPVELLDSQYNEYLLKDAIKKSIEYDKKKLRTSFYLKPDSLEKSFGIQLEPSTKPRESMHNTKVSSWDKPIRTVDSIRNIKASSFVSHFSDYSVKSPSPTPSISTTNNETIQISNHRNLLLDDLKDELLQVLLTSCVKFTLSTLIKLGNLRLADTLLTRSNELDKFTTKLVFLFQDYLIVVQSDLDFSMIPLRESVLSFENGVVQIINNNELICMNSPYPSIIEKWVVGLSDFTFDFPPAIITSTLDVSQPNGKILRFSDSTINIIEEVSSGNSAKQDYSSLLSRSSRNSSNYSESYLNDNQTIQEIMQRLDVKSLLLFSCDSPISTESANYPEPDIKDLSPMSLCQPDSELCNSDFASDSDDDSDLEVIKRYIQKHT